jgi:hypothetical protein
MQLLSDHKRKFFAKLGIAVLDSVTAAVDDIF